MKRLIIVGLMAGLWAFNSANGAPASGTSLKIGFVNIVELIEKAPQAESARKTLEREFAERDAKLTAERDAILAMEERLKTDGEVMSATKRDELERDLIKRRREFNRAKEELQEDLNLRRNEELDRLQREVYQIIVDLAKSESYDLLVTERVLYASENIDITDRVLAQLKKTAPKAK